MTTLEDLERNFSSIASQLFASDDYISTDTWARAHDLHVQGMDFGKLTSDPVYRNLTLTAKLVVLARDQGIDAAVLYRLQYSG